MELLNVEDDVIELDPIKDLPRTPGIPIPLPRARRAAGKSSKFWMALFSSGLGNVDILYSSSVVIYM